MTLTRFRGLSLVEGALAAAILGLAFLPVLTIFTTASRQTRQTSDHKKGVLGIDLAHF